MEQISTKQAKSKLSSLINETSETHRPIYIKGKRNKAVLVSEEDWRAMEETIYLLSIPRMRESIVEGMNTSFDGLLSEKEFYAEINQPDENK